MIYSRDHVTAFQAWQVDPLIVAFDSSDGHRRTCTYDLDPSFYTACMSVAFHRISSQARNKVLSSDRNNLP